MVKKDQQASHCVSIDHTHTQGWEKSIVIDILYFFVIENTKDFTSSEIDFLYFSSCNISKFAILIVLVQIYCPLRSNCTTNNHGRRQRGAIPGFSYMAQIQ